MTQQPGEFLPTVGARAKELRDAARKGRDAAPEGFVPVYHLQKLAVLKEEMEHPQMGPVLCKESGAKTPEEGFALAIKFVGHMDHRSIAAGKSKYEARKKEEEEQKAARKKEREEKKAKDAAERVQKAAAEGDLMHSVGAAPK
jgi:hypothetical protein